MITAILFVHVNRKLVTLTVLAIFWLLPSYSSSLGLNEVLSCDSNGYANSCDVKALKAFNLFRLYMSFGWNWWIVIVSADFTFILRLQYVETCQLILSYLLKSVCIFVGTSFSSCIEPLYSIWHVVLITHSHRFHFSPVLVIVSGNKQTRSDREGSVAAAETELLRRCSFHSLYNVLHAWHLTTKRSCLGLRMCCILCSSLISPKYRHKSCQSLFEVCVSCFHFIVFSLLS